MAIYELFNVECLIGIPIILLTKLEPVSRCVQATHPLQRKHPLGGCLDSHVCTTSAEKWLWTSRSLRFLPRRYVIRGLCPTASFKSGSNVSMCQWRLRISLIALEALSKVPMILVGCTVSFNGSLGLVARRLERSFPKLSCMHV